MNKKYYLEQSSVMCYSYGYNEDVDDEGDDINEYTIDIQHHMFEDGNMLDIITNFFIAYRGKSHYFCSVIWDKKEYGDDDVTYAIAIHDSDPKYIVYRDDLSENVTEQYLIILQAMGDLYAPTTNYKHFDPNLEKIPLSKFNDDINIVNEINSIKNSFNSS